MKGKLILAFFIASNAVGFSQKAELKSAAKALKSGDLSAATASLKAAESLLGTADEKMKAQYYFLKGEVSSASSGKTLDKIEETAMAYQEVLNIEKASKSSKYTAQASQKIQLLRKSLIEAAIADQDAKRNKEAAQKLYLGYKTNKQDTTYLYYAASNAVNAREYDMALEYYNELVTLGYTGIETKFVATNKETGKVDEFASKQVRDISVKAKTHIKPEKKKTESKKSEITKNIALIYSTQGKNDEALKAIELAKQENPNDASLKEAEANLYYKLGDVAKYKEIMEQIVANDPNNPDLLYNLGVSAGQLGDKEKALEYYKKALSIRPNYGSAQINIASTILGGEKELVEEMNALGNSTADNKRYEELKAKKIEIYKEAAPYLEGALKSNPDNIEAVRTLMGIYYQLDDPKADEMKSKLKALEGGI